MLRTLCSVLVITMLATPAFADTGREPEKSTATKAPSSATCKRVIWTVVGAGAGFAAGVYLGFAKFDDATYAERKIWTTAIVGAAAGGVAGGLLSRTAGPRAPTSDASRSTVVPDLSWSEAIRGPSPTTVLKR